MIATAMMTFCRSGPSTATNPDPDENGRKGKDRIEHPTDHGVNRTAKYPAARPKGTAMIAAAATEKSATRSETRAP